MTDPLLPPVPEPGDSRTHDAGDDETVTLLQSFMVSAAVSSTDDPTAPGVPTVVFDLVLVDAFAPTAGAMPIRILVEHSDKSSRTLLAGLQRSIELLDNLAEPRS